jgi:hypothetical protein
MRLPTPLRLITMNGVSVNAPGGSRHNDPDTSFIAAQSINATELEWLVWRFLFGTGRDLTALEIARGMRMDIRSISPRLAPLARKNGVIRFSKRYCVNDAGNPTLQTTWLALP